jgi:hypothetical protein
MAEMASSIPAPVGMDISSDEVWPPMIQACSMSGSSAVSASLLPVARHG